MDREMPGTAAGSPRAQVSRLTFVMLPVMLLSLAVGALEAREPRPRPVKPVITLGALITMSETGDPDTQAAIRLATRDVNAWINRRGPGRGIRQQPRIRLVVEGTGLDPEVAREKIEVLADQGLRVIIGPESSAEVETIAPFTNANGMVLISHCSTAPSLAIPGDGIYRMVPSDAQQAVKIAELIFGAGYRAVVPMWRAGVWGDDISFAAIQRFSALGGVVYPGLRFDPEADDHGTDLAALDEQVADARVHFGADVAVAFFSFGTEGATVLAQASEIPSLGAVTWYGSDGTALSREILNDPRAAQFAVQTGFFNTLFAEAYTPDADAIRARISTAMGGGDVHFCATAAYDAVWLAALSALAVGTEDLESFKTALETIAASHEGASGRTTLDAAGDRAEAAYDVWAIEEHDGQYLWMPVPQ